MNNLLKRENLFYKILKIYLFDNLKKLIDGLQKSLIPSFVPRPLDIYSLKLFFS